MYSSIIFLERSRIFDHNVLHRLTLRRHMGGGPRTFPGGLNKWQWKRLHEKQARQKEKQLLDQEKQLYQARVRSEIRSKMAKPDSSKHEENTNSPNDKPLSPKDHIKVLADRFMKEGAEDLWNEADGPIRSSSPQEIARIESNHNPINLRRVISGQNYIANNQVGEVSSGFSYNQLKPRHFSMYLCSDNRYSLLKARHYSVRTSRSSYRKNDSSSSEDVGTDNDEGFLMTKMKVGDQRRPRLSLIGSSDGEGSDDDDDGGKGNGKKLMMSIAALGKYDIKKTKRIPLKFLEEDDLSLHVNQSYVIAPHEQHFQIVHHLLKEHVAQVPNYKVIVFCTTRMMTSLMFFLLREMKMSVREIHSRKSRLYRTCVSDEFKEARQLILITPEMSARGMNYPDVSLVIQVGVPTTREQYINRLGRTGREGKGGEGIMLLAPWEEYFLEKIKDLPLRKSSSPHLDPDTKVKIEKAMAAIDPSSKEAAYRHWLWFYNSIREM